MEKLAMVAPFQEPERQRLRKISQKLGQRNARRFAKAHAMHFRPDSLRYAAAQGLACRGGMSEATRMRRGRGSAPTFHGVSDP